MQNETKKKCDTKINLYQKRNGSMNVLRLNLYIVHYLLYRDSNISVKVATRKKGTLLSFQAFS